MLEAYNGWFKNQESLEEDGVSFHLGPQAWQHLKIFGGISFCLSVLEHVVCLGSAVRLLTTMQASPIDSV